MDIDTTIQHPALKYFGGKWNLGAWIISFFPPHTNYSEPFFGGGSVFFQKPRSIMETVNDLDSDVVNYFRVLREQPQELIDLICLTPWSREEFQLNQVRTDNALENARRFFTRALMAMGRSPLDPTTGPRMVKNGQKLFSTRFLKFDSESTEHLLQVAQRLQGVQIENKRFEKFIPDYDTVEGLTYADPPYVLSERTGKGYIHEFSEEDHRNLAELLRACKGSVVLSGYACPLYVDLYEEHGWTRHDIPSKTNSGKSQIESVWLSPITQKHLSRNALF